MKISGNSKKINDGVDMRNNHILSCINAQKDALNEDKNNMTITNTEAAAIPNREHKSSVFALLFGTPEEAARMCNMLFGTNYGPNDIEMATLVNVLFRGRINDLAFVVDGKLVVLIEHQSTINPNMVIRMLEYYVDVNSRLMKEENLYGSKPIRIARPEFIVLYNGVDEMLDYSELRLSDLYIKNEHLDGQPPALEMVVKVYNINKGRNPQLAERNPTLDGYETLIAMIRENQKTMSLEEAIKKAVNDCIEQNILKDFLLKHKQEVMKMTITEWDFDVELKVARRESREAIAVNLLRLDRLTVDEIADASELTIDDVLRLMGSL